MPLARSLYLLPLALAWGTLFAQEPTPKPEEKPVIEDGAQSRDKDKEKSSFRHYRHSHRHRHSTFSATVQAVMPLRDLKESLDQRTGYGLGAQWTHEHGDWHASRTRLEWNTFPESGPVGAAGTKTYAKNYILSFDHLFKLNTGTTQAYVVGGLGGARWCFEQTTATTYDSRWTTKLAITGGVGVQFANRVNLEARYVVSSVGKTFDANTLQASLGFRF